MAGAGNTFARRVVKRALGPLVDDRSYAFLQSVSMGWDIRSKAWWEPELGLIDAIIKPGETALDIGANYGLWSYHLAKAVGPTGRVYAFEPVPFTASAFRMVARMLKFDEVVLINKGCAEKSGQLRFTQPLQDNGRIAAGLVYRSERDDTRIDPASISKNWTKTREIVCEVVAIDEYLPGLNNVALIKTDVEGADLWALQGARKTIERNKPVIVCEIHPAHLKAFGITVVEMFSFFRDLGYEAYHLDGDKLRRADVDDVYASNWIFVHPETKHRVVKFM